MRVLLAVVLSSVVAACAAAPAGGDVEVTDGSGDLAADAAASGLTAAQAKDALLALTRSCADTWCTGDFKYEFEKITCAFAAGTCTTTMLIVARTDQKPVPVYWRSCKVGGLHRYKDLVGTSPDGGPATVPAFFDEMSTCVIAIEEKLPPVE